MITLSFWPILVASVVSFAIGALWYSPALFGKEWMSLNKMTAADISAAQAKGIWKLYAIQFIVTLITFIILGFFIRSTGTYSATGGAFMGFLAWLGFVATSSVGGLLWENKPFKLVLINVVSYLLTFVIGGAIIGAWN
jgi:hypothetical protein